MTDIRYYQDMAFYNKIGLLVLNEDRDRFLVCQKYMQYVTADYIMPGGKNDEGDDRECLKNEIKQELNCDVDFDSLRYVGEYTDIAAGRPDREVKITLYEGSIIGEPVASAEIEFLHWIGEEDIANQRVSPIVRNKIIPDLVSRRILT